MRRLRPLRRSRVVAAVADTRPARVDDVALLTDLFNRVSQANYGEDGATEDDLRTWLEFPSVELDRDTCVVTLDDGAAAAYVDVYDPNRTHERYWVDLRVDLERAPTDTVPALIAWAEQRARSDGAPGALLRVWASSVDDRVASALRDAGYRLIRHSLRMSIDLDGTEPPVVPPQGVEIRSSRPGEEQLLYEVSEECFRDHWEHTPQPYEEWEHYFVKHERYDPTLWFLACEGEEVAGYALCRQAVQPEAGYVASLGVRRPWRRRGIGDALLRHTFHEFARRGYSRVFLGVDAENLTGAVRLYERAGMRPVRRLDCYEKAVGE